MVNKVDINVEPRKEWVAPELKKVSIAQITANTNMSNGSDGLVNKS
jgi:hypothetical protein